VWWQEKGQDRANLLGDAKQAPWIARTSGDTRQTKDLLLYKCGSQDQRKADSSESKLCGQAL